jgi:hypothetical protein
MKTIEHCSLISEAMIVTTFYTETIKGVITIKMGLS